MQDNKYYAQVAVLGAQTARDLFPSGEALGQRVKINHLWVKVIGVLEDKDLTKDEFQGVSLGGDRNRVFLYWWVPGASGGGTRSYSGTAC